MYFKQLKVTIEDIAEVAGLPLSTVRRHRKDGVFNMDNFEDVVRYCAAYWMGSKYRERIAK